MIKKVLFAMTFLTLLGVLVLQFAFVEVPTAARALTAGHLIVSEDIIAKRMFFADVPEVLDPNSLSVVGRTTSIDVAEGSLMMPFLLAPLPGADNPNLIQLDKDSALVPLVVSGASVPSTLTNGQTVQMIVFFGAGEASLQLAFTHSLPYTATVHTVRTNELGETTGVDIITHRSLVNELALASIQGRIMLTVVHEDVVPSPSGTDVNQLHNKYFGAALNPAPAPVVE